MLSTIYSKALIFALLIIVVFSLACGSDSSSETKESTAAPATAKVEEKCSTSNSDAEAEKGVVRVLNQDMGGSGSYTFVPNEFIFEKGQNVTFELVAETEYHTFTVDDLKIDEDIHYEEERIYSYPK